MLPRLAIQPLRRTLLLSRHTHPSPQRPYATKTPGPTSQFYKTFTRPVAKVLLLAIFTYQFLYWGWAKLETDEVRAATQQTIEGLEAKVEEYKKKTLEEVKVK